MVVEEVGGGPGGGEATGWVNMKGERGPAKRASSERESAGAAVVSQVGKGCFSGLEQKDRRQDR